VVKYIQQEIKQTTTYSMQHRKIQEIKTTDKNYETIATTSGENKQYQKNDLIRKVVVQQDQPVTLNPNVGGFGKLKQKLFTRSSSYLWILSILYLNYYQSVNVSI
jgi:hypothetical protein